MYTDDSDLREILEDSGALTPLLGASEKVLGAEEPLDLTFVPREIIARAKSIIDSELEIPAPFIYEGITITITELSLDGDTLRVDLETDLDPVYVDAPFRFINAPLQVVTEEAVYSATEIDETGMPVLLLPRVTEDAPDEVLLTIVGQAVHGAAVRLGWKAEKVGG
jgi:hypothetical protein